VPDVIEYDGAGAAGKGCLPGNDLIEHGAEGEEVAATIEFPHRELVGGHVGDGATACRGW